MKEFALQDFYNATLELAKKSIMDNPKTQRNVSGVTVGISQGTYQEIVKEIGLFRKKILGMAKKDLKPTNVFQLGVQLFPLAKEKE